MKTAVARLLFLLILAGLSRPLSADPVIDQGIAAVRQRMAQARYDEAIAQLQLLRKWAPGNPKLLELLEKCYAQKGNFYAALEIVSELHRRFPENREYPLHKAQYQAWLKFYDEAIRTYKDLIASDSTDLRALVGLADVLSWKGEFGRAARFYRKALQHQPDYVEAILGQARILAWENRFSASLELYKKALELQPENAAIHKGYGEVLGWAGQYDRAIQALHRAISLDSTFADAYHVLAQVYAWKGDTRSALTAYQKAINLDPENLHAWLDLAKLYEKTGRFQKAKQAYLTVLRMDPRNRMAKNQLREIGKKIRAWKPELFLEIKNLIFIGMALMLLGALRRHGHILSHRKWFRWALFRLFPALTALSFFLAVAILIFGRSFQKQAIILTETIEVMALVLLSTATTALLWLIRFGRREKRETVLAIGAHPDDLEFGCGGTLLRFREEGHQVIGMVLSRGESGKCRGNCEDRVIEAKNGAKILNLNHLFLYNFPDTRFASHQKEIQQAIEKLIERFRPTIILTHTPVDLHGDHQVVFEATKEAARGPQSVLMYENPNTPSHFTPDFFVDISGTLDEKIAALKKHKTQSIKEYIKPEVIRSMARFRGRQARIGYAEAFKVLKYIHNHAAPFKEVPNGAPVTANNDVRHPEPAILHEEKMSVELIGE
jgi:LmbE family N-acetylglucosaminyl deacetylase/tetratricopeptide (TPR) repeat protein